MEADLVYYRRRSAEEANAAEAAFHPNVRHVHLELAAGYEQRVAELEAERVEAGLHLVAAI
jgi:hypothetical protein